MSRLHWSWLGLIALILCAPLASAKAPAVKAPDGVLAYNQTTAAYFTALAAQCGGKHLNLLSPSELLDVLDAYKSTLTMAQRKVMDAAEAKACKDSFAGATCNNFGNVKGAAALGLTKAVATYVCKTPQVCTGLSTCHAVS